MTMSSIPVVNLEKLTVGIGEGLQQSDWEKVGDELRHALHHVGFVYLINHGIPSEVIDANFAISKQFFELPQTAKEKYKKDIDRSRNGWVQPGQELLHEDSKYEYRECYDMTTNDRIYPKEISNFSSIHSDLELRCHEVIKIVLKLLAVSLKLSDADFFVKCCKHLSSPGVKNECDFSMIYYPPIFSETNLPPDTVRCAEHTDYEVMTFLFQNQVGGLEIKTAEGKWISADPIPNAILVNTGDLLEMWTSKYYKATLHRVIIPKTEEERRLARYSFAYFIAPDNETLVRPIQSPVISEYLKQTPTRMEKCKAEDDVAPISAYDHIMKRVYTAYGVDK